MQQWYKKKEKEGIELKKKKEKENKLKLFEKIKEDKEIQKNKIKEIKEEFSSQKKERYEKSKKERELEKFISDLFFSFSKLILFGLILIFFKSIESTIELLSFLDFS